ncbi:retrovirus-related pol polyprotein from transposon TNT 1-94 [Tanacetum coccineum]
MTRSSTKELLSPFENPEQKFRSKRRLFDTPSLIESNSSEFYHIFDIKEQSEEKVRETMTEIMEQYMSKTRGDYGGSEHEDANEHIKKVLEIVDLFYIPKVTQDQIMLRAFLVSLTGAASRWLRNQPSGSITTWEGAIPSKTVVDTKIAIQETAEYSQKWHNGTSLRTRSTETYDGLVAIQAQLNNLRREIKKVNEKVYAAQVGCEQCKGPHYTKDRPSKEEEKTLEEAYYTQFSAPYQPGGQYRATGPGFYQRNNGNSSCDDWREARDVRILDAYDHTLPQREKDPGSFTLPCFIHNICFDKALVDLGASVSVMPFSTYINLGLGILSHTRLTIELADQTIKQPRGIAKNVLVRIGKFIFPIDFIILDIPEDEDVPLILGRPFLSTAHSKIDVFKRKITLRVREEKLVFKSIKPATSIIKRVFVIKSLDSKTKLIGEGDESFDPTYGFTIIDDDDMTKDVVLGIKFCKKYASCQMIMKKFALGDNEDGNPARANIKQALGSFQDQERYEHVGPQDTRPQDGERSQDDDQRLDLADDLKKAQDHISSLNTSHKTKTITSKYKRPREESKTTS